MTSSISTGPVHNAVRRMTELIDLENLEGYFDEYLLESQQQQKTNHHEREFDDLPEETSEPQSPTSPSSGPQSRFITIESYTKIRIERPE
ncbi:hypothetical protein QZH41_005530 [Actinostola sp. cb2023]|nr:hypothetical protein QZH41_005530 [Actinostola sp. cb2023]